MKITTHDSEWHPKYFGVVTGLFCSLYMIANTLGPKLIDFYGMTTTAAMITFPICAIISDLLTEIYGFNRTRQAIWTALAGTLLFGLFTQIGLHLKPACIWPYQQDFSHIFSTSWRFAIAGCLAWLAGEFVNSYIMSKLKILQDAKWMCLRFILSTVAGQLCDTIVVLTIAFYGTLPNMTLLQMILLGWALKIAYEIIALPLSIHTTKWLKKKEGIEHFDKQKISVV